MRFSANVIGTIVPEVDSAGKDLKYMIQDIILHPERYNSNENENIKRNGEEKVWTIWTNQPLFDEENRLKELLCIGINHTEQKLAEELFARQLQEKATAEERNDCARPT